MQISFFTEVIAFDVKLYEIQLQRLCNTIWVNNDGWKLRKTRRRENSTVIVLKYVFKLRRKVEKLRRRHFLAHFILKSSQRSPRTRISWTGGRETKCYKVAICMTIWFGWVVVVVVVVHTYTRVKSRRSKTCTLYTSRTGDEESSLGNSPSRTTSGGSNFWRLEVVSSCGLEEVYWSCPVGSG